MELENLKLLSAGRVETLKFIKRSNFQHMKNLVKDTLWDLPNLETFNINDNGILTLQEKTFRRNTKLREISFFFNRIQFLPKALFENNLSLENIDFGFNILKIIETSFFGLGNIKEIEFNGNICIDGIDANFKRTDGTNLIEFLRLITVNCSSIV